MVSRDSKDDNLANSLFLLLLLLLIILGLVFWPRLGDPCVCQSPIGVYVSHFLGQMLGCAYTIRSYGQISISCSSPCPPCRFFTRVGMTASYFRFPGHFSVFWSILTMQCSGWSRLLLWYPIVLLGLLLTHRLQLVFWKVEKLHNTNV